MKVSVKKDVIVNLIKESLSNTESSSENKEQDSPVSVTEKPFEESPVTASNKIEQEGMFELPPVEDDRYEPKNLVALSHAAFALSKTVPPKQVGRFYRRLHDLVQDAIGWQQEEEMNMGTLEEKLRKKIRNLIIEAGSDISGMMSDFDEDEPAPLPGEPGYEEWQAEIEQYKGRSRRGAKATQKKGWDEVSFKKKKKDVEFFDEPGYKAEPPEEEGGYGHPGTLEFVADNVEGLNTPSAVRQFLADPRKINLMDKIKFLIAMPEKERQKIMIGAAADFITQFEKGKQKEPIDHNDPVIQDIIEHYISDLQEDGALDEEDAKALRGRTEYVVELDTFKHYATEYFDNNFDDLIKYAPFRRHLKKFYQKRMRDNPELQSHVEKRKGLDIERAKKKKAAVKARKK